MESPAISPTISSGTVSSPRASDNVRGREALRERQSQATRMERADSAQRGQSEYQNREGPRRAEARQSGDRSTEAAAENEHHPIADGRKRSTDRKPTEKRTDSSRPPRSARTVETNRPTPDHTRRGTETTSVSPTHSNPPGVGTRVDARV